MFKRLKRWWRKNFTYSDWHDTPCEHGLDCDDILYHSVRLGGARLYGWKFPALYEQVSKKDSLYHEEEHYTHITYHALYECPVCERRFHAAQRDEKFVH